MSVTTSPLLSPLSTVSATPYISHLREEERQVLQITGRDAVHYDQIACRDVTLKLFSIIDVRFVIFE